MIKAVFFDLFFTLIYPQYSIENNEYDVLGISAKEWEHYAENNKLYTERALGNIKDEDTIINRIIDSMPYNVSEKQKNELLYLREARMQNALLNVDNKILDTVRVIQEKGIKICLISNADVIDCKYWNQSPLVAFFNEAVFSCDVGLMKPDSKIYEYSMKRLNVDAYESLFVGDGGSDELSGAKKVGMKTVLTEYLHRKEEKNRKILLKEADYYINQFDELINIVK